MTAKRHLPTVAFLLLSCCGRGEIIQPKLLKGLSTTDGARDPQPGESPADEQAGGAATFAAAAIGPRTDANCASTPVLVLSEAPGDCEALAEHFRSEASSDALSVALQPNDVGALSSDLTRSARRCHAGACDSLTAKVTLDEYSSGTSATGRIALTTLDGAAVDSPFAAIWCDWDALLGPRSVDVPVLGLELTDVALYQGVKVSLREVPTARNADVVAARDALVRTFVKPPAGWQAREVLARLTLSDPAQGADVVLEQRKTVASASTDATLASTFNFSVPKERITEQTTVSASLLELGSCADATARSPNRWPMAGSAPVGAKRTGTLDVRLVPVRYMPGGNLLPDTSTVQLQRYRDLIAAMYPVAEVNVAVREPINWNQALSAQGDGWDSLLDAIADLRSQDAPPASTYYYGIVSPTATVDDFCANGCVAGIGYIAGAGDTGLRAALGLGFAGSLATETLVHELGHNHGRRHAPCGDPAGVDPGFPYANARLGAWGYDMRSGALLEPNTYADMMGYCNGIWVSDYTYRALGERIAAVNNEVALFMSGGTAPTAWRSVMVRPDGRVHFGARMKMARPDGSPLRAVVLDESGAEMLETTVYRYEISHIPTVTLLVPEADHGWHALAIEGQPKLIYPHATGVDTNLDSTNAGHHRK